MGYSNIIAQDWKQAQTQNTIQSYCLFLQEHFDDEQYSEMALQKIDSINDQIRWLNVKDENTIWGYCHYLHNFPNGNYVDQAHKAIAAIEEDERWEKSLEKKSINALVEYINLYPEGKYAKEAEQEIDKIEQCQQEHHDFIKAKQKHTVEALSIFIQKYPNGLFREEAVKEISFLTKINERLKTKSNSNNYTYEDIEWRKANAKNTLDAYGDFYKRYPKGEYHIEAKSKIDEQEQLLLKKEMQKCELLMWEQIKLSKDGELCKEYLKKFPKGEFQIQVKDILYQINGIGSYSVESKILINPTTKRRLILSIVICIVVTMALQWYFDNQFVKFIIIIVGAITLLYLINRIFFSDTSNI